jgi:hypothetical protein
MDDCTLEILTEEPSMKLFLEGFLPRILPKDYVLDQNCFIRPHEGKSDLKRAIPKKMRAYARWGSPVKVLVLHDQDSNDCMKLKQDLANVINASAVNIPCMIRIACRELENWYLGDFDALQQVYPEIKASALRNKSKYRNPDQVFGAHEIGLLSPRFSKTAAARTLGAIINIENNNSPSFQQLLNGLSSFLSNSPDY